MNTNGGGSELCTENLNGATQGNRGKGKMKSAYGGSASVSLGKEGTELLMSGVVVVARVGQY